MRPIVFAICVLAGLSAALAQDSAMPLGLTKYVEVLRGYSEKTQKDLGRGHGMDGPKNAVAAVRDAATADRDLAQSRYVRDISLGLLAELVSLEKAAVSYQAEMAKAPGPFGPSRPVVVESGRPVRRPTPPPGSKEREATITTFHRKKADVAKNVASRLLLLEKHAATPAGESFSLPADDPYLAQIGYHSLPPAPRIASYRTMEFEISEILPKGLLAYMRVPDSTPNANSGVFVTDRLSIVFLRNYDAPVTPGDSIRVMAGEGGMVRINGIARPQYVVLKQ